MSARVGFATIDIIPSAKGFSQALGKETGSPLAKAGKEGGSKLGGALFAGAAKFAGPLAAAFAGVKVVGFLKDAVAQASDLNEAGSKLQQVFGKGTAQVLAFASQGAKALGQNTLDVQNAAATFGVYGKAAGLAGTANAQFSDKLVGLSTDLASFYNVDPTVATDAIAAGLRGESEPLRQFGVLLNESTLRQEALKLGIIKTTKTALTPQQRVLAAQAVIMKQTQVAQGDFARTSGGLANQQRILSAQWTDAKGKLGQIFLPVVREAVTLFNKGLGPAVQYVLGFANKLTPFFSKVGAGGKSFSGLGQAITKAKPYVVAIGQAVGDFVTKAVGFAKSLKPQFDALVSTFLKNGRVFAAFVTQQVVPLIRQMVQKATPLIHQFADTFRSIVEALVPVYNVVSAIGRFVIKYIGPVLIAVIKPVWGAIVGILSGALRVIKGVFEIIGGLFSGNWSKLWKGVKDIFGGAWGIIVSVLKGALNVIWALLKSVFGGLAKNVGHWFAGVGKSIGHFFAGLGKSIGHFFAGLYGTVKGAITGFISSTAKKFGTIVTKIVDAIKSLPGKFLDMAGNMIDGMVNGIKNGAHKIIDAIKKHVTDALPGFVKKALGINSPSRVFHGFGLNVAQGMANGITAGAPAVTKAMSALTGIPEAGSPTGSARGALSPLVGSLTVNAKDDASAKDALDEAVWTLRRIARGGVYA